MRRLVLNHLKAGQPLSLSTAPEWNRRKLILAQSNLASGSGLAQIAPFSSSSSSPTANSSTADDYSFITTPIYYANAEPHVGHLYSTLLADAMHRWESLKYDRRHPQSSTNAADKRRRPLIFSTGTDEHGSKIAKAAASEEVRDTLAYCTEVSQKYSDLFQTFGIRPTDFVRTTEARHREAVQYFWTQLERSGSIYKGTYSGWYCVPDEAFYTDTEVETVTLENGETETIATESGRRVEWVTEENYLFRIDPYRKQLTTWLSEKGHVEPDLYVPGLLNLLENLPDISVSRSSERMSWGIPVPNDPSQTVYVWLDALVNYLTVTGYPNRQSVWPPTLQVIGMDITRFHALFWPAFLMAAGLELPKRLYVHSHWLLNRKKMSKTTGNTVDPREEAAYMGLEAFRYFLLRAAVPNRTTNYSRLKAVTFVNDELCNMLGNLLNRSIVPKMNPLQTYPPFDQEAYDQLLLTLSSSSINTPSQNSDSSSAAVKIPDMVSALSSVTAEFEQHMDNCRVLHAVESLCRLGRLSNRFYQNTLPWKLIKQKDDPMSQRKVDTVNHLSYEAARIIGILLLPIIPETSDALLSQLGIPAGGPQRGLSHAHPAHVCPISPVGQPLGPGGAKREVLFKRLELPEEESFDAVDVETESIKRINKEKIQVKT